jgi:hypothetical protein
VPDRDAVERALEAVLDRLRPKPVSAASDPVRAGARRKGRPGDETR